MLQTPFTSLVPGTSCGHLTFNQGSIGSLWDFSSAPHLRRKVGGKRRAHLCHMGKHGRHMGHGKWFSPSMDRGMLAAKVNIPCEALSGSGLQGHCVQTHITGCHPLGSDEHCWPAAGIPSQQTFLAPRFPTVCAVATLVRGGSSTGQP